MRRHSSIRGDEGYMQKSSNKGLRTRREHLLRMLYMAAFYPKGEEERVAGEYFDHFTGSSEDEEIDILTETESDYLKDKLSKILEHLAEIDTEINAASEGWKTKRMNQVDLSVLRLAVYEMKWDDEVPVKVAINEAVDLVKKYGMSSSGAFVNGILGKIAREMPKKNPETVSGEALS